MKTQPEKTQAERCSNTIPALTNSISDERKVSMNMEQISPAINLPDAAKVPVTTMGTRDIADLLDVRSDSVKRTVERLVKKGAIGEPPLVEYLDSLGRMAKEYRLEKRDSFVVVAQLSPEFTARLVDRWQELEGIVAAGGPAAIDVRNPGQLALIASQLIEVTQEQAKQIEAMQETVEAHDRLCAADGSLCITDAAKSLGIRRKDLFAWLEGNGWIFRRGEAEDWLAYATRLTSGVMEHRVTTFTRPDGTEKVVTQARVTPKGLSTLAKLIFPTAKLVQGGAA